MTLQECYTTLGGNYKNVLGRLQMERIVSKFVLKFLNDKSYDLLCTSIEAQNYDEAFRAAHTIKGVCQNLSFDQLGSSSSNLCEALRNGYSPEVDALLEQTKADYQLTRDAILAYQETLGT